MELNYKYKDKTYAVNVVRKDDGYLIDINNKSFDIKAAEYNPGFLHIQLPDSNFKAIVSSEDEKRHVFWGGKVYQLEKMQKSFDSQIEKQVSGDVESPISGKVVKIEVQEGQDVEANQLLLIIEAMKMEYRITAPFASKVLNIEVEAGKQVEIGKLVVKLEDPKEDG